VNIRQNKRQTVIKIALLLAVLLLVGLAGSGCIEGLQPIGWSGGVVSDGTLFVGSKEGKLVAVNVDDESRQWSEPLKASGTSGGFGFGCLPAAGGGCDAVGAGVAIYGTPAVSGDRVYIGGYNGKVYSYDLSSLQMDDVYPPEGNLEPIVGGVVAAQGNVYFGDSDGKVYALDESDLIWKWEFATGDKIWATPAVEDGTVYIGSFDKKLYAFDAADGSLKWEFTAEGAIAATPLIHDNTVYIGSFDRYLYALNATDGSLKWKFMGENWFWAKPVVYDDTIYAGCLDGKVYVLRADNGNKVTEFELDSPVSSSPVVVDSSIIFASREGVIYSLNTSVQKIKRLADIEERIYGPICESEGIVYIHTQDLTLRRVNANNGAILVSISLKSKE